MNFRAALTGLLLATLPFTAHADETLLLRQPALSKDHFAFVYAGDIWITSCRTARTRCSTCSASDPPPARSNG